MAALRHHFAWPGLCLDCKERIEEESRLYGDRLKAIEWARAILERSDCCILDTETTSLSGYALELAIIALDGTVLFHSLINPEHEVTPGARAVHGITDEELAVAPRLPDLWPQIQEALAGRSLILSYGVDFDEAVMHRSARRYQLPELAQKWDCLKEWYAQYYGQWSDYWGNYKW